MQGPSNWFQILTSLLVAFAATIGTMVIHGFVVHTVVVAIRRGLLRGRLGVRLLLNLTFVSSAALLAFAGHLLEIVLWAFFFELCGAVTGFSAALYSSAGSYTTMGSGDLALSPRWRLLGPLEAATGMVMFGISTALIFAVIQRLVQARLDNSVDK